MKTNATKNIIVIDDDNNILNTLKMMFRKENLEIKYFDKPEDVLKEIKNKKVDCIISDIEMPEINGIELIREIQKEREIEKIIFMSSNVDKYLEEIKLVGGYALKKPVKKEEIMEIIKYSEIQKPEF